MNLSFPTPAIFAHRGASRYAPENTLSAFQLALEQRADGIELDVHLSADGEVVVIHDRDLSRTTNGAGYVDRMPLTEIRQVDAGQGQRVPTLTEVLDLVGTKAILNIELKGFSTSSPDLPQAVLNLLEAHSMDQNVIISCFQPRLLAITRRLQPEIKIGLLMAAGVTGGLVKMIYEPILQPSSLHPNYSSVGPRFLQKAKSKGRRVLAYTVNQPEDMRRLFGLGIDGIITDDPRTAIQVREEIG